MLCSTRVSYNCVASLYMIYIYTYVYVYSMVNSCTCLLIHTRVLSLRTCVFEPSGAVEVRGRLGGSWPQASCPWKLIASATEEITRFGFSRMRNFDRHRRAWTVLGKATQGRRDKESMSQLLFGSLCGGASPVACGFVLLVVALSWGPELCVVCIPVVVMF